MKKIPFKKHGELFLEQNEYSSNKTPSISLNIKVDGIYEPYLDITTNIEGAELLLSENECLIKTWSENVSILPTLLESGYFKDTFRTVKINQWCEASIWEIIKDIKE